MTNIEKVYQAINTINNSRDDGKLEYANLGGIEKMTGLDYDTITQTLNTLYKGSRITAEDTQKSTGRENYGYIETFLDIIAV